MNKTRITKTEMSKKETESNHSKETESNHSKEMGHHHHKISTSMMAISLLIISTSMVIISEAQPPSCGQKLVPCANYMNSVNPPASCCTPLKEAIEQDIVCLCNLYNTPGLLESFGINITQALELPVHCKISGDLNACTKGTGTAAPSPLSAGPSPVPGKDDNHGSARIAWTGFSGVLLFLASTMIIY